MRIVVTGSNGKLGRPTVERLSAEGHEVLGLDVTGPAGPGSTRVELSDYGQTLDALHGVTGRTCGFDAVVHLAAIPVNGLVPDATTFHRNIAASFNVLFAAHRVGIRTIILASSITAQGYPFDTPVPRLPLDEEHTEANNSYGLSKVAEEAIAEQVARWTPETSITSLRFANVVAPGEYGGFEQAGDPDYRRALLGTYVDARDGALAISLALAAARPGYEIFTITASESGSATPSADLARRWFPGVPVRDDLAEFGPLLSVSKAERVLGYRSQFHWRDELARESQEPGPG